MFYFIIFPMQVTIPLPVGDNGDTYLKAQIMAARLSAQKKVTTYVSRNDNPHARMGLGVEGLPRVLTAGAPAYWGAHSRSWSPMPDGGMVQLLSSQELTHV